MSSYTFAIGVAQEHRLGKLKTYACPTFKRKGYRGLREPKCCGGEGCVCCWNLYYAVNPNKDHRGTSAPDGPCS